VALVVMAAMTSSETSAQSSEATQVKPNGGGRGTDAGSLEGGLAAEKRGDWKTAFLLLRPLALDGNADAQDQLGFMYETGQGVGQDRSNAVAWYQAAARNGNAHAQTQSGILFKHEFGSDAYPGSMELFRKAADQGNADGQFQLGVMYYYGQGVPKDYAEAMKWFRKAANQGNADAQNAIGAMYYNGEVVPKDDTEAVKWYRKAADQGNADAQENLKKVEQDKKQVEQDKKQMELDKIIKLKLAARKEVGDTVCYPSSCKVSSCVVYGQVDEVHNDKIKVMPVDSDRSIWINYNEVIGWEEVCHL